MVSRAALLALLPVMLSACDTAAVEREAAAQASAAASAMAAGKGKAEDTLGSARQELARASESWLAEQAKSAKPGSIESWVGKGAKALTVAGDLSSAIQDVVERETVVEPIIVDVPEGEAPKVDAAIEEMPRVEVVDGVQVGFRAIDRLSTEAKSSERAYVVMWRKGDRLYGFFYRSKQTIHVDRVVEHAPKLMAAIEKAAE
jgi:hypothetical protein